MYKTYTLSELEKFLIQRVYDLECRVYADEYKGALEAIFPRYYKNRDCFVSLHDGDALVGCLVFFPVRKRFYARIRKGDVFFDDDIGAEEIVPYKRPGNYHLFILSAVIEPVYQHHGLSWMLIDAFHKFIEDKRSQGFIIASALAVAISGGGEKLLQHIGFNYLKPIDAEKKLYEYIPP